MASTGITRRFTELSSSGPGSVTKSWTVKPYLKHWVASGPGSPWLVFKLPVQPTHGGQTVRFEALALLPEDVEWRIETLLYHEWWNS